MKKDSIGYPNIDFSNLADLTERSNPASKLTILLLHNSPLSTPRNAVSMMTSFFEHDLQPS